MDTIGALPGPSQLGPTLWDVKTRSLVLVAAVVVVATAGLLWLLIAYPQLSAPVEAVAVVLGTAFTAFAAYSALRAAQASRAASADTLRRERHAAS